MPFEQTITVINNSGKIVSTGKHLIGIFKEARSAYREKKEALRYERAGGASFRRAHTFSGPIVEEADDGSYSDIYHNHQHSLGYGLPPLLLEGRRSHRPRSRLSRSRSIDDIDASPHASRGPESSAVRVRRRPAPGPPLTASNLRAHSEISATGPSVAPLAYRTHGHVATTQGVQGETRGSALASAAEPLDMNLAYGTIPPDLVSRRDLEPCAVGDVALCGESDQLKQEQAKTLVGRIESLLDEAHCIHHSAASIIAHLQGNPEAAAAVALTLAELSNLLSKMSPAFLGIVKGGSPAVFALLASPQFLIGTGIAVGVTIVLFGGWRIIKRIKEAQSLETDGKLPHAFEATQPSPAPLLPGQSVDASVGYEEALVLEEELSTIDTWRRGILPPFDGLEGDFQMENPWATAEADVYADVELISPEAMRSRIGFGADDDRRTLRSVRTDRGTKTGNSAAVGAEGSKPSRHRRHHHHRRPENHQGGSSRDSAAPAKLGEDDQQDRSGRRSHNQLDRHRDDATIASANSSRSYHNAHRGRGSHRSGGEKQATSRAPGSKTPAVWSSSSLPSGVDGMSHTRGMKNSASGGNMLKQLFKKKKERAMSPVSPRAA